MRLGVTILAVAIGLLSIAAGVAKVMLVPDEAEFLGQFGLSEMFIMIFGALQVAAGLLMVLPRTRRPGGIGVLLLFLVSTVLILVSGNLIFGVISFLPVILAGFIVYQSGKVVSSGAPGEDD